MKKRPLIAGFLSLIIPGLGQIHAGEMTRGGAILAAAIIIGNLNITFLPIFTSANPDPAIVWAYWIPRIGHDVMALWSIAFLIWCGWDAYALTQKD